MTRLLRHTPRKRFGQNFLHDPGVIARILSAFDAHPDDPVIEIGPGQGALTGPLLEQLNLLQVIEVDRDLGAWLEHRYPPERCKVHIQDALKFDFSKLANAPHSLRVIGNLPYNISTPLIFHLLEHQAWIRDLHFMLQKEVVARMCAQPGSRDYGRLSVMLQLHCRCEPLFQVGPGAFKPPPRVESEVVRLVPHTRARVTGPELKALDSILRQMFSRRRKTVRNSLRGIVDAAQIQHCGIDATQRPEQLDVEQFIQLARHMTRGLPRNDAESEPGPGLAS